MKKVKFNSNDLKNKLWETLISVKSKRMAPNVANSISTQARAILRVVAMEISVAKITGSKPTQKQIGFIE